MFIAYSGPRNHIKICLQLYCCEVHTLAYDTSSMMLFSGIPYTSCLGYNRKNDILMNKFKLNYDRHSGHGVSVILKVFVVKKNKEGPYEMLLFFVLRIQLFL